MTNLKEVRVRIASVKSTRQITSAMKMVSASKLRKGQIAISHLKPYEENLNLVLNAVQRTLNPNEINALFIAKPITDALVIVIASSRGLCGTFNSHVGRSAVNHINKLTQEGYNTKLWVIGKKAEDFIYKSKHPIDRTEHQLIDHINAEKSFALARDIIKLFEDSSFQRIDIIYNKSKKATFYDAQIEQLLPILSAETPAINSKKDIAEELEYILEPSTKEVMDKLANKSIEIKLFSCLLESFTSEQGARMAAMHKATDNATELLKNLSLVYNKIRQSSITNELVEIISGSEALNS